MKSNFKSLIIWSAIIILYVFMGMSEFSSYAGNKDMLAILDAFPKAVLDAFSFSAFNLTTVSGYYGVMYSFYALILCIHASLIGSSIISKEERDKTVEFLLVMPVSRERIMTSKIFAAFANCFLLLLVTVSASFTGALRYLPDNRFIGFLLISAISLLIMQMIFLSAGILLGCALKRYKRSGYISISIVVGAYFLSVIIGLGKNLDSLKYITPFKYQDPVNMLNGHSLHIGYILLSLGITVFCFVSAFYAYKKRDLYI